MKPKRRRLTFVLIGLGLLGAAAALTLSAFEESIVFFYSPSEVREKAIGEERRIRVGGLVEEGSIERAEGGLVRFRITDMAEVVPVVYTGILPDLFREGQGVVAEGRLASGVFQADEVLARHDENYMPPEVADALKKSGQWQHMERALQESGQMSEGAAP